MTALTGDDAQFHALIQQVDYFATNFVPDLAQQLAADSRKLLEDEYATGKGPDGNAWWPNRRGSTPPLTKTGYFRGNWRISFGPATVTLQNDAVYAAIHNFGGWTGRSFGTGDKVYIPKRRLLPDDEHGLGPIWGPQFELTAAHLFHSILDDLA